MRRVSSSLRTDRPAPDEAVAAVAWDGVSWGFTALDGLPDLEEASGYTPGAGPDGGPARLSTGLAPVGFDPDLRAALARLWAWQQDVPAGLRRSDLSVYEQELLDALVDRRDAAVRLRKVLEDDIDQFDDAAAGIRAGCAVDLLDDTVGGAARRTVTDAVAEFESARHRFRVALVAVGVDGGLTGADIGAALRVSRQLASRSLKEARAEWPELQPPGVRAGRRR